MAAIAALTLRRTSSTLATLMTASWSVIERLDASPRAPEAESSSNDPGRSMSSVHCRHAGQRRGEDLLEVPQGELGRRPAAVA
jgi:hypothetical protein